MNDLQKAIALIALAEQTYIENYYGKDVIPLFTRNKTTPSTDAGEQYSGTVEGK